jgi:hypothetical protein
MVSAPLPVPESRRAPPLKDASSAIYMNQRSARRGPDIIAIDGKTPRRSHNKRKGRNPFHLVSAWAARQRIVVGQQATEEKSNEIAAIPLLLKHLDLKGTLVTMATQTDIAHVIQSAQVGQKYRSRTVMTSPGATNASWPAFPVTAVPPTDRRSRTWPSTAR